MLVLLDDSLLTKESLTQGTTHELLRLGQIYLISRADRAKTKLWPNQIIMVGMTLPKKSKYNSLISFERILLYLHGPLKTYKKSTIT